MVSPLPAASLEIKARLLEATPTPTMRQIAPYPRALCTYLYRVEEVVRGNYEDDKILVVKWAVWERAALEGLPSKVGQAEQLTLKRWIDCPEYRTQRVVDATGERELVMYYDASSQPAVQMKALLDAKNAEMVTGVVRGQAKDWLFLADELQHAETGRFWNKDWQVISRAGVDPLPAMLDFQRRLQALGVELWILPVPTRASLHADKLKYGLQIESQAGYLKVLQRAGLKVIDLECSLRAPEHGNEKELLGLAQDSHWHPRTCMLAAESISNEISRLAPGDRSQFSLLAPAVIPIRGDLARMAQLGGLDREIVEVVPVQRKGEPEPGVGLTHPQSPVVLLGDSHVTVFSAGGDQMHGRGSGLPDHLARQLGFEVDVVASHGDGVNQARANLYQQRSINPKYPGYWKNKKAVIWVFAAREFTRAERWSTKIPVVKRH